VTSKHARHSSHIRSVGQINSLAYKLTKSHQRPYPSTQQPHHLTISSTHHPVKLRNPSTPNPVNSQSYNLAISPTQKLKLLFYILQSRSKFHSVLAKKIGHKVGKKPLFLTFCSCWFVTFKEIDLHFAPFSLSSLSSNS